jgi:ribosome assembly protein RRB1
MCPCVPHPQNKSMLSVTAHASDVNVLSWNRATSYMLASGGDDGALRVWDLRAFSEGSAVANFTYHRWAASR